MKKYLLICFLLLSIFCFSQEKKDSTFKPIEVLDEVYLFLKDPISEKKSVTKMSKIDIYLNPSANADPLKAIPILPVSTNVEETANPSLRGSNGDRSRVYLNGTPILNPVKFGRDNGLGNFSLFNTEIIDKQYIYASNPPLTFGNSTGGIVEIETNNKLREESVQVSLALSNLGTMWNKKISENNFIQIYGNYQFDKPFLKLNNKSSSNLKSFFTLDLGANTHVKISDKLNFNSFNYFIHEKYDVISSIYNFSSNAIGSKKRFLSVNNLNYISKRTRIRYATMFDYSLSDFIYGNINSNISFFQYFNAVSLKTKFTKKITVQYGMESSVFSNKYDEIVPVFYYAHSPSSPILKKYDEIDFYYVEPYLYLNFDISSNFLISAALRKNIFLEKNAKSFISYQLSSYFRLNNKNKFIISSGQYHSYSTPNFYIRDFNLLESKQVALDYLYENEKINISSAIYYKSDSGNFRLSNFENYDRIKTFGLELSLDFSLYKYFRLSLANSYIDQKQFISNKKYNTVLNLNYFIKTQIIYNNPTLFNCSLLFTTHPGNNYTSVNNSSFNPDAKSYEPSFDIPFSSSFSNYNRFDFSINKLIALNKSYIIAFFSINNIFDKKNQSSVYYDENYSTKIYDFFQRRIVYFGMQLRF